MALCVGVRRAVAHSAVQSGGPAARPGSRARLISLAVVSLLLPLLLPLLPLLLVLVLPCCPFPGWAELGSDSQRQANKKGQPPSFELGLQTETLTSQSITWFLKKKRKENHSNYRNNAGCASTKQTQRAEAARLDFKERVVVHVVNMCISVSHAARPCA